MLQSESRCWVEIDLTKIENNFHNIQKHLGMTKIMAVVKANCYGHGDFEVANLLQDLGVDFFAVSSVDEAVRLRLHGIHQDILILGYTPEEHFHYLTQYDITQCIMSLEYAQKLDCFMKEHGSKIRGHVKVDTGMSRLGIPCIDQNYCIEDVKAVFRLQHLETIGIFSHFSVADSFERGDDEAYTFHQIELFEKVLYDLRESNISYGLTHIQNSYGCLNYPELNYDYARPGIILVGNTSDDSIALKEEVTLLPAMEWKASISLVKEVKKGTCISYGRNYVARDDMLVATMTCGYADGLNRQASHQHHEVLIKGTRCEIIGNICMDQCMIDVSNLDVKAGDVVTIVGRDEAEHIKIDELSRHANTINNDSFCMISKRVPRFYKK